MMAMLRTHYDDHDAPSAGSNKDICMHAGGFIRRSQTCGSMVSRLSPEGSSHFFTGTSAPCLSLFQPAGFEEDISYYVVNPDDKTVAGSLWKRHEPLHRRLLFFDDERSDVRKTIAETENRIVAIYEQAGDRPERDQILEADLLGRQWHEEMTDRFANKPVAYPFTLYGRFWKRADWKVPTLP